MIPFLRWAGSKKKLLPHLIKYRTQSTGKYIEPFMGSASLFFALEPNNALLGDTNPELITTFKAVRNTPETVHNHLRPLARTRQTYYAVRDSWDCKQEPARIAARFIYLNRLCFNGIYRTNKHGAFNVPYSGDSTGSFPSLQQLITASAVLKHARLHRADFAETLKFAESGDFVYLDPPYSVSNRRIFKQYGASVFGVDDLERLADWLTELDKRNVLFVLSYALCKEALTLFSRWQKRRKVVTRNVSGFAKHRRCAVELLVSNIDE